jgi:serine/threonine protein kinase
MNKLTDFLKNNLRIIEFNSKNSFFPKQSIKSDKFLSIIKNGDCKESTTVCLGKENFLQAIKKNSSDAIIMNCTGWKELKSLQKTAEAKYFFERITLFDFIPIIYLFVKGLVSGRSKFNGLFYLKRGLKISLYVGIKKNKKKKRITRHYLSPLVGLEEFFKALNNKNISYCILRWFEDLPNIGDNEDVDILVEDKDLTKVYSLIDKKPGIIPFDIYSKTGISGSDFNHLPYYVYSLAERVLLNTMLYKNVYKVPTMENYFFLLAYHVVFHKGEESGIPSKQYKVTPVTKSDHDYLFHLKTILTKANIDFNDFTLEGLHNYLDIKGYVPPLDTQYKLSLHNQYLKAYLEDIHHQSELLNKFEGLVCFVIREKIIEAGLLEDVVRFIQKAGFTIIESKRIGESLNDVFTKHVRGGNWNQGPWPSNAGKPSGIVVAFDVLPIKPDKHDHKKHPGLTNKRILSKSEIRKFLNKKLPDKGEWCNGIHSSDNEIQAVEYMTLAGLDKDKVYRKILKYRKVFETQYPVLKVLSCYSRRAKIELISYKGGKAIQKTFKPNCEVFLSNEIAAYTIFGDIIEVPKLLETGENYIITSFIEGSEPLGHRIDIRTLKKCLNLLRKIFERGYSLLDFKPSNFLIDKSKNIHLIDFEFLHKYRDKLSFLECYDLVGAPDNIDLLYRPIIKIPKGKKQFDVKWGSFTGISYEELSNLDNSQIYFKSFYRFYYSKIKKLLRMIKFDVGRRMKMIFRALP